MERTIRAVHIPFWYRALLRGLVVGIVLGTILAVSLAGIAGLFVLLALPLLLLVRKPEFDTRELDIRIDDSFEILEGDVAVPIPLAEVHVHEHRGETIDLEVRFPYQGRIWHGVIARKDNPGAIIASDADDPATYAQIHGILASR